MVGFARLFVGRRTHTLQEDWTETIVNLAQNEQMDRTEAEHVTWLVNLVTNELVLSQL